jgi:hypothetical protein
VEEVLELLSTGSENGQLASLSGGIFQPCTDLNEDTPETPIRLSFDFPSSRVSPNSRLLGLKLLALECLEVSSLEPDPWKIQLELGREEWRRRHPKL